MNLHASQLMSRISSKTLAGSSRTRTARAVHWHQARARELPLVAHDNGHAARRKLVEQAHGHADLARGEDNRSEVFQKDAPAAVALFDVKMTFAAAQSALPLHKQ